MSTSGKPTEWRCDLGNDCIALSGVWNATIQIQNRWIHVGCSKTLAGSMAILRWQLEEAREPLDNMLQFVIGFFSKQGKGDR